MNNFVNHLQADSYKAYALKNKKGAIQYGGRDGYYKIGLICGTGIVKYDRQTYKVDGSVLLITSPGINCTWLLTNTARTSYVCTFKDNLLNKASLNWVGNCDQYFHSYPVYKLDTEEAKFVQTIFCRMIKEQKDNYLYKKELIQNQICILAHIAIQKAPAESVASYPTYPFPLTSLLLELIELQFPLAAQALHFN